MDNEQIEIEAKIKVDDVSAVRQRLNDLEAEYLGTVLQTDTYYDRPDGWLRENDRGVRIRRFVYITGPDQADARPQLTCKGPRDSSSKYKARVERQFRLDDVEVFEEMLSIMGMEKCLTIQKRRGSYLLGNCRIELDELPMLGFFVEIEAPAESDITTAMGMLGLHGESITDSYVHLAQACCNNQDLAGQSILFGK